MKKAKNNLRFLYYIFNKIMTFCYIFDRILLVINMTKKKILTGLQPTGTITLGNYIGSIKQMIDMQDEYESYLFIADLHAITIPKDPIELKKNRRSLLALYLACGIDKDKNHIFYQSENIYHANISWLLECNTYYGELSRMTQFKEKSKKNSNFTVGLLTYPVLMAADILAYDVDYVPVGIDQKQHVEIARDIAIRFNKKYGETFKVPEPLIKEGTAKIYDLVDPTKKMSKSSDNSKGIIYLLDDEKTIRKKIMGATTDSLNTIKYDPINQPGISNLISIYSSLNSMDVKDVEDKFKDYNYGEFKKNVADIVVKVLLDIQEKYYQIIQSDELDYILDNGLKYASTIAKNKLDIMLDKMGFKRK